MPTYVYRRKDGTTFEHFQSITADALTQCPTTGQAVQRVISGGTGFILKGSGFYKTDYASNSPELASENGKVSTKEKDSDDTSATTKDSPTKKEKVTEKDTS